MSDTPQFENGFIVHAFHHFQRHEVDYFEVPLLSMHHLLPQGFCIEPVLQYLVEVEEDLLSDLLLVFEGVCKLEGEDGLALTAVGAQLVNDIIEGIVYTLVESEVTGYIAAIA